MYIFQSTECLSVCLSVCLSIYLSVCLLHFTSVMLCYIVIITWKLPSTFWHASSSPEIFRASAAARSSGAMRGSNLKTSPLASCSRYSSTLSNVQASTSTLIVSQLLLLLLLLTSESGGTLVWYLPRPACTTEVREMQGRSRRRLTGNSAQAKKETARFNSRETNKVRDRSV